MPSGKLNEEQAAALATIKENRVSVLCGAPGVGKTYTCKAVLEWAQSEGLSVAQAAPTGKAAKRMMEATEFNASTIHRLLLPVMSNGKFEFRMGPDSPLPYDLIILDEMSMIDTWLMNHVMAAIDHTRTRVLFVGDPDQLPSIGPGSILKDMIGSGVIPVSVLTQIQRNAGDIVKACHSIKAGVGYEPHKMLDLEAGHNLRHIEANERDIPGIIESLVTERFPARGYDSVWGVQVLSPTNKKTNLSCEALNERLRARINPVHGQEKKGVMFRAGDKVIQTQNKIMRSISGVDEYIVNGDMGTVDGIQGNKLIVTFTMPDRTVLVPIGGNKLLLAYAITCHRAQGSEFPVVIIPVTSAFGRFVDRCWIYTAISRARDICVTIGEFSAIRHAIGRVSALSRQTGLADAIVNEYARHL